jgi:hypothetical protein
MVDRAEKKKMVDRAQKKKMVDLAQKKRMASEDDYNRNITSIQEVEIPDNGGYQRRIGGDVARRRAEILQMYPEAFQSGGSNSALFLSFYIAFLFVLLTPGILFRFPKGCGKLTVAAVHGLLLVVVYYFTSGIVLRLVG